MTQKTVFVFIETTPYKFCIKEKYSTGGLLRLVISTNSVRMCVCLKSLVTFPGFLKGLDPPGGTFWRYG